MKKIKKDNSIYRAYDRLLDVCNKHYNDEVKRNKAFHHIINRLYNEAEDNTIFYLTNSIKNLIK